MVEKEIESVHADHSVPSGREVNLSSGVKAGPAPEVLWV